MRPRTLAVMNQKGGVGKSTLATFISEYFALYQDKRVLFIDLDMQCNSSDYWVGMEPAPDEIGGKLPPMHPDWDGAEDLEERSSIADIFYGKAVLPYSTWLDGNGTGPGLVDVMVGHPRKLEEINRHFRPEDGRDLFAIDQRVADQLLSLLSIPDLAESYDVVVIDTGPSRNPTFRAALRAATHIIVPFEPEDYAIQGINGMLQIIRNENYSRTADDQLRLVGFVPNKIKRGTVLHRDKLEEALAEAGSFAFPQDCGLPNSIAFPERNVRTVDPKTVFHLSQSHPARQASERVGEYTYAKLFEDA